MPSTRPSGQSRLHRWQSPSLRLPPAPPGQGGAEASRHLRSWPLTRSSLLPGFGGTVRQRFVTLEPARGRHIPLLQYPPGGEFRNSRRRSVRTSFRRRWRSDRARSRGWSFDQPLSKRFAFAEVSSPLPACQGPPGWACFRRPWHLWPSRHGRTQRC